MKILLMLKQFVKKLPILAGFYRYHRDNKALNKKVLYRSALGFNFNGLEAMEKGFFELCETKVFEALIGQFELFVNVGANTGYYVLKALKKGKEVLAFEPNQHNVCALLKNIEANNFDADFHLFPIALSSSSGLLPMHGGSTGASLVSGWAGNSEPYLVPVNSLKCVGPEIYRGKKSLVFIDVEGAEFCCLKGALSLVEDVGNVFMVEITVTEHQPKNISINPHLQETFDIFYDRGYRAYTVDAMLREVMREEVESIAAGGVNTFGVHNFLFIRSGTSFSEIGLEFASH